MAAILVASWVSGWLIWHFLDRRADHLLQDEASEIGSEIGSALKAAANEIVECSRRLPTPLNVTNAFEASGILQEVARRSGGSIPFLSLGIKTERADVDTVIRYVEGRLGTNLVQRPLAVTNRAEASYVRDVCFPVIGIGYSDGFADTERCDCWLHGSDLFRFPPQMGKVNGVIYNEVIGTALPKLLGVMSGERKQGFSSDLRRVPEVAAVMMGVYSPKGSRAALNPESRFPETVGLLLAGVDLRSIVQVVLNRHQDRLSAEFAFGMQEFQTFEEAGKIVSSQDVSAAWGRSSAPVSIPLWGWAGRLTVRSGRAWEISAGTWAGFAIAILGTAVGCLVGFRLWGANRSQALEAEAAEVRAAMAAVQETRASINRELHDSTLQNLYALGLELNRSRQKIGTEPEEAMKCIGRGLDDVRRISAELRQFLAAEKHGGEVVGLAEVFESIIGRFGRSSGLLVQSRINPGAALATSAKVAAELAHILREALSNAHRHGEATAVTLVFDHENGTGWCFELSDNGRGFDPAVPRPEGGMGLSNMQRRAKSLGCDFEMTSAPGQGVRIIVRYPGRVSETDIEGGN